MDAGAGGRHFGKKISAQAAAFCSAAVVAFEALAQKKRLAGRGLLQDLHYLKQELAMARA
jgi:hypothetical protein